MINPAGADNFAQFVESLLVDFNSRDDIPLGRDKEDWRAWGNYVASLPTFSNKSVPTTENFPNWRKWAIMVYGTMAR